MLRSSASSSLVCSRRILHAPLTDCFSTAFDRMVTIRVGNGEEPDVNLHVYRGLLCHYSTTFQKPLGSQSDEPALIDTSGEADTVRLFFRWLNTGSLVGHRLPSWQDIINAYLFAESFGVRSLQNHSLDMFLRKHAESNEVPVNAAHIVYQESSPADPFRRLLIHVVAERWGFERSRDTEQELPSAFWHDLVDHLRIQSRAPGNLAVPRKEWIGQECRTFCDRFHVHTKEEKDSNDSKDPELPNVQHLKIATGRDGTVKNKNVEDAPDCDRCGEPGHFALFCPFRESGARPSCFNCDGSDHIALRCPKPKDWSKHRCNLCKKYGHNRGVSGTAS